MVERLEIFKVVDIVVVGSVFCAGALLQTDEIENSY